MQIQQRISVQVDVLRATVHVNFTVAISPTGRGVREYNTIATGAGRNKKVGRNGCAPFPKGDSGGVYWKGVCPLGKYCELHDELRDRHGRNHWRVWGDPDLPKIWTDPPTFYIAF